VPVCDSVTTSP